MSYFFSIDFSFTYYGKLPNRKLKQLWDYVELVTMSTEEWNHTLWKDLDVETMDMECKKLAKHIRGFDKTVREWQTFKGLETNLKNMLTALRAIGSLQNPAIRERHWEQLVVATRVTFTMTEHTRLADLLREEHRVELEKLHKVGRQGERVG